MKIYIGADHRGIKLEQEIITYLESQKIPIIKSSIKNEEDDDYPDFAFDVANKVAQDKDSLGILICGNGIGISIAANKVKNIRCARVTSEEDTYHAKTHNGANIISFGGISFEEAKKLINIFISTNKVSEERHLRRINKIIAYEKEVYK